MDWNWEVIVAGIMSLVAGGGIIKIAEAIKAHRKSQQEIEQSDHHFIKLQYREMVADLEAKLVKISEEIGKLQEEHVKCQVENARLQVRIDSLHTENTHLTTRVSQLEERLRAQ